MKFDTLSQWFQSLFDTQAQRVEWKYVVEAKHLFPPVCAHQARQRTRLDVCSEAYQNPVWIIHDTNLLRLIPRETWHVFVRAAGGGSPFNALFLLL